MNTSDVQLIMEKLNSAWNVEKFIFPGPQPISIERKHFKILKSNEYLIGHKNDGERFALCFTRHNDKPRCFLLNRKLEISCISLLVSKKFYEGSIFDCEVVDNTCLIFDCPLFAGKSLKNETFKERLSFCNSFIAGIKIRDSDVYNFRVKQFVERTKYKSLEKCDKTDGYIFVPVTKPVQTGTHNTYFKWKPLLQNTIDFCLTKEGKVFLQNSGKLSKTKITLVYNPDLFNNTDSLIVECEYIDFEKWKVLQVRNDKTIPNSLYTFKRTLVNIEEDIQFHELVS